MMLAGGAGSRCRVRMLRRTSAEWTPWAIASAQAASTAGRPSVRTALRMSTICRVGTGELAPYTFDRSRQHPVLEGSAVTQGTGFASQHRHVMPGIVDGIAAAERT